MAKERTQAEWREIDPATLTGDIAKAYNQYKEAYRIAKGNKDRFEAAMSAQAGLERNGLKLIFSYNFGKLSIAVVPNDKPKAVKPATQSLSEWLTAQAQSGKST